MQKKVVLVSPFERFLYILSVICCTAKCSFSPSTKSKTSVKYSKYAVEIELLAYSCRYGNVALVI